MPAAPTTNGHRPRVKASDVTAALDDGDGIAALLKPFHAALVESGWDAGMDTIGVESIAFDLEMREVQSVLGKLAKRVKGVAETTREEIRALVGKQAQEGWSVEELAARILEMGEINSKSRATAIARSETASGYSQGSLTAWRASGVVDRKEWLLGPEPCDQCTALGGKIVGLDDDFADGIDAPPAHTNCVCAVTPHVSED